jgi:hypothetical protein
MSLQDADLLQLLSQTPLQLNVFENNSLVSQRNLVFTHEIKKKKE